MKMNKLALMLGSGLLCLGTVSVRAQGTPGSGPSPAPPAVGAAPAPPRASTPLSSPSSAPVSTVTSPSYKVGPEDVLAVKVARHIELDSLAQVLDDGSITLPRVGRLVVGGKTLAEIQGMVSNAYKKVFRQPEVSVAVQTPRTQLVYVFGEVNKPGPVEYKEGTFRITEALGRAGGTRLNPNRLTMTLTRRGGGVQSISPRSVMESADSPSNVEVRPGDTLVVNEIPPQPVFVSGALMKPGMFDLRDVDPTRGSIGVMELVAMAGGPTPQASLSQAYILRADRNNVGETGATPAGATRRQERVNLSAIQKTLPNSATVTPTSTNALPTPPAPVTLAEESEVVLYPGDTLHIPESRSIISVTGNVNRPGAFPISDDRPTTLAEAISLAGGADKRAKLKEVGIIRQGDPAKGTQTVLIKADMMALLKKGDVRQNPQLQPGDVVFVPETSKPDWFGKVIPGLAGLTNILYLGGLTN